MKENVVAATIKCANGEVFTAIFIAESEEGAIGYAVINNADVITDMGGMLSISLTWQDEEDLMELFRREGWKEPQNENP